MVPLPDTKQAPSGRNVVANKRGSLAGGMWQPESDIYAACKTAQLFFSLSILSFSFPPPPLEPQCTLHISHTKDERFREEVSQGQNYLPGV